MSVDPDIIVTIEAIIDERLRGRSSVRVGVVSAYRDTDRRVDVQPLVGDPYTDRYTQETTWEDAALIRDLPVAFMGTSRSTETIRLQPGDTGLILTLSHSADEIIETDLRGPVRSRDPQGYQPKDSFFLPVDWGPVSPFNAAPDRHISGSEVLVGDALAAEPLVTRSEFNAFLDLFDLHVHGTAGTVPTVPSVPVSGTSNLKAS